MSLGSVTKRLPRSVVQAAVESVVAWRSRSDNNRFYYTWNGYDFEFVYPDSRAFAYLRNAIDADEGVTGRERVPLSYLQCPDHVDGIIDAGAHFGVYTVILGVLNRDTPLIAYEPSHYNAGILEQNVEANGLQNIDIREMVINSTGQVEHLVQPNSTRVANRFYENTIGHSIHIEREKSDGGYIQVEGEQLSSIFVEEEWQNPFVKLDIEGAEHEVIDDLLDADLETLQGIVELHPDRIPEDNYAHEILYWFEERGFDFECVKDRNPSRAAYWFSTAI